MFIRTYPTPGEETTNQLLDLLVSHPGRAGYQPRLPTEVLAHVRPVVQGAYLALARPRGSYPFQGYWCSRVETSHHSHLRLQAYQCARADPQAYGLALPARQRSIQ